MWRFGKASHSCALSLVTHDERLDANDVREWLAVCDEIVHSTIEIHQCPVAYFTAPGTDASSARQRIIDVGLMSGIAAQT